jgi:hypothetical protein
VKRLLLCLCAALLIGACGKKGNPLPPLQRIPGPPGEVAVTRLADQVYVRFTVPVVNIDGAGPADVANVDLYAITHDEAAALADLDPRELREAATLIATTPVRRPPPQLPAEAEGMPALPVPAPGPGVDQGAAVIIREELAAETRVVATLPDSRAPRPPGEESLDVPRALSAPPSGTGVQRHYFAVAVSTRGRYGPHSGLVPAPLVGTSGPPSQPRVTVTETAMTLQWTPPADARGIVTPADPDVLPSRPIVPGPSPTMYDVYEVARDEPADALLAVPEPVTPKPVAATEVTQTDIALGRERCFYVRAVDLIDGVPVRGPASPVACASFADTFPPSAPTDLVAVAVPGGINLLWEPSGAKDVAGYLVLRGDAAGATLAPVTAAPVTTLSYRDETAQAGVRYVYAVVAVDGAGNRSGESNRVEETAQ